VNTGKLSVSFSSQNCNSLNLSGTAEVQAPKIVSILNLNTDIIFLSDTRLSGKHRLIEDAVRTKYKMYHNSSTSKRGVAILLGNQLDFEVFEEKKDNVGNVLLLRMRINDAVLVVGAVYGPNDDNFEMYDFLQDSLLTWNNLPWIMGGGLECYLF